MFKEHGCSGSRDAPMGSGRLPRAAAAPRTAHFDSSMRAALEPAARAASQAASRAPRGGGEGAGMVVASIEALHRV